MASLSIIRSSTTITMNVYNINISGSSYSSTKVLRAYLDGVVNNPSDIYREFECDGTITYTFEDLSPSTTYSVGIILYQVINGNYQEQLNITRTVETRAQGASVDQFLWDVSNGSATSRQTYNAYCALTKVSGYTLEDFSYKVWNDIVDKITEVLDSLGYDWDTTYLSYSNTRMSSGDKTLTADRFNSVNRQIKRHYGTGVGYHDTGDIVYGNYILEIVESLNDWIESDL